ncbi:conjugal transfer protein TraG N-terminal domain-containing protein [bacterium]|nr:conjugal transfer protein TraG N-terminal domain-containing protein [bacterium]
MPDPVNSIESGSLGTAGSLIAAALETGGHYLQSGIIDTFSQGLSNEIGAVLYIAAAIGAIMTVALGGRYLHAMWFIAGPILFQAVVFSRTPSIGPSFSMGQRPITMDEKKAALNEAIDSPSLELLKQAKVSVFFSTWVQIVDSVNQGLIKVIFQIKDQDQLQFLLQSQIYAAMLNSRIEDPALQTLTKLVLLKECAPYVSAARSAYDDNLTTKNQLEAQGLMRDYGAFPVSLDTHPYLRQFMDSPFAKSMFENPNAECKDPHIAGKTNIACADIWNLAFCSLKQEARRMVLDTMSSVPQEVTDASVMQAILKKLNPDTAAHTPAEQFNIVYNAVAARMMNKALKELNPGSQYLLADRDFKLANDQVFSVNKIVSKINVPERYKGVGDFLEAMLALPYVQGMLLFYLSLAFPFFALALIIPGRYELFLAWMALWAWVKSWDVGMAAVMLLEKILWSTLPGTHAIDDRFAEDPGLVFKQVLGSDPLYSMNTHYLIIAGAMAAVPVLTGFIVKRGAGEIIDAVGNSMGKFAGRIGNAMRDYESSIHAQNEVALMAKKKEDAVMAARGGAFARASDAYEKRMVLSSASQASKGGIVNNVLINPKSVLQGQSTKSANIAGSIMDFEMANNVYKASISKDVLKHAWSAVSYGWYNHDFQDEPVWDYKRKFELAKLGQFERKGYSEPFKWFTDVAYQGKEVRGVGDIYAQIPRELTVMAGLFSSGSPASFVLQPLYTHQITSTIAHEQRPDLRRDGMDLANVVQRSTYSGTRIDGGDIMLGRSENRMTKYQDRAENDQYIAYQRKYLGTGGGIEGR